MSPLHSISKLQHMFTSTVKNLKEKPYFLQTCQILAENFLNICNNSSTTGQILSTSLSDARQGLYANVVQFAVPRHGSDSGVFLLQ